MASTAITPAQAELISSLSQDEIPIKLRCAICSRLAVNAFRLPCCDQAICETCQSTLPSSCPVCEHNPVTAEDCKPHKSLRTTIKVFLRTEEKKREAIRLKEAKLNSPPVTPAELKPIPTPFEAPTPVAEPPVAPTAEARSEIKTEDTPAADQVEAAPATSEDVSEANEDQQDIPQPSIEEIAPGQEPTEGGDDANQADDTVAENGEGDNGETGTNGQAPGFGAGFGFDPSAAGGFAGMGMGGDFNQMQMMMAMQNGMAPNAFGTFPMMGMPGMNMDPMAMQNMQQMMMNGGFGGGMNGMNGMNMGMGMAGFDGGAGTGFNNGWNGQQSWNVGQDNFNHPNAAGMGHGDYGSNNSGYNPQSAGYNQGNYGRGQYNDYQNNNYGYRGRGRGRGYGRGGYGYGSNDQFSQQQYPQQFGSGQHANGPISETGSVPTGPKAATADANVDEFGREIRHNSETKDVTQEATDDKAKDEETSAITNGTAENGDHIEVNENSNDVPANVDDFAPKPIQTLDEAEAVAYAPNGTFIPGTRYLGGNPGFQARGANHYNAQPQFVKPVDVPINAPTGPKAMRVGLPNTGLSGLRASQAFSRGTPDTRVNGSASASVAPEPIPAEKDGKDRERSESPPRDRSRSRERKRSRSRDRHSRSHRHRSRTPTEEDKETERRRERRRKEKEERREREHNSRKEDADEGVDDFKKPTADDVKEDKVAEERSRSASPSDSKRSSHRSRRDKDKYRERDREDRDKYRERDDDREHKSSHKHRSSRRHHDDRSRSRDRSDRDRSDRDRTDRDKNDKDREDRHRHRRSRHTSEDLEDKDPKTDKSVPPTPIESEHPSRRPSIISNGNPKVGIEIKGTSSRRKNGTIVEESKPIIPTGPRSDRKPSVPIREKEKDKVTSSSSRRHEEDSSSHHRSSRRHESSHTTKTEKDRSRPQAPPIPTAPAVQDPHTLEREARNRERLLKEAQRIAGLTGMAGAGVRKRSRDDIEEAGSGRKGRKKRGRGEESEEARIARLEAEREGPRWG